MSSHSFAAALLRSGSQAFAGLAAARLFETDQEAASMADFEAWRQHLHSRIQALAAAVEDQGPELFAQDVLWSRTAFEARTMPVAMLANALGRLEEVLADSLPPPALPVLPEYFALAQAALRDNAQAALEPAPISSPSSALAREYLALVRSGDERASSKLVLAAVDSKQITVFDAIDNVITYAQAEMGRLWHRSEIGVDEEHFATHAARKLLTLLSERGPDAPNKPHTVVVASVAGDAHDLGAHMVAVRFRLDGWKTIFLSSDVPIESIVASVQRFQPTIVALGATLPEQRLMVERTIEAIRVHRPKQFVIVGGRAFAGRPDLWRKSGADALGPSAAQALLQANEVSQR